MKSIVHKLFLPIYLIGVVFFSADQVAQAQVYGNSQTSGSGGACIGCNVSNGGNAIDASLTNYATINQTVGALGAYVYQEITYPSSGAAGNYVGIVIEDDNLGALNVSVLGALTIKMYNGATLQETKTITGGMISLVSGSTTRYRIEFAACCAFNKARIQVNAGVTGAINNIRVYYVYHSVSPLPIDLMSFTAQFKPATNSVQLNWQTASEINNDYFTIEKTTDGVNYRPVGYVKGGGNSVNQRSYEFEDMYLVQGNTYYRLKQTDFSGNSTYSLLAPVVVPVGKFSSEDFAVVQKANDGQIHLSWLVSQANIIHIDLYDIGGRMVDSRVLPNDHTLTETTINGFVGQGMYIVSVWSDDKVLAREKMSLY